MVYKCAAPTISENMLNCVWIALFHFLELNLIFLSKIPHRSLIVISLHYLNYQCESEN